MGVTRIPDRAKAPQSMSASVYIEIVSLVQTITWTAENDTVHICYRHRIPYSSLNVHACLPENKKPLTSGRLEVSGKGEVL